MRKGVQGIVLFSFPQLPIVCFTPTLGADHPQSCLALSSHRLPQHQPSIIVPQMSQSFVLQQYRLVSCPSLSSPLSGEHLQATLPGSSWGYTCSHFLTVAQNCQHFNKPLKRRLLLGIMSLPSNCWDPVPLNKMYTVLFEML